MTSILRFFGVILLVLVQSALCARGVDASRLYSQDDYSCMRALGYRFAIIRGFRSYGAVDSNAVTGLTNAKNANLITDIYMFVCRGKSANSQVDAMMSSIPSNLYGMIWIDVEINPSSGCSWASYSYSSNCDFLVQVIRRIKNNGKNLGIYTSKYMWTTIMGSRYACPEAAEVQLWYAHYDNLPSFSDFIPFGGWNAPNIKQYAGDSTVCGASVDLNYY